jgi:hypothetical protein
MMTTMKPMMMSMAARGRGQPHIGDAAGKLSVRGPGSAIRHGKVTTAREPDGQIR